MLHHLGLLFGRALTGKIEITGIKAADRDERVSPRTSFFNVDQLEEAAEYAESLNTEHMWNVYVGAALRRDDVFPGCAADDTDFLKTYAVWADADDDDQVTRARAVYQERGIQPPLVVVTGRTPTRRAQLWWPLETPIDDINVLRSTVRGIADALGTDHGVLTGKQLMRLAGTLAWPKPNKPGRMLERTEVIQPANAARELTLDQIHRAFAPAERPTAVAQGAAEAVGGSLAGAMAVHDLRSALASMRSDDRDLWIRMGHALKPLGDPGMGLWLEWSQASEKYDPADAMRTWNSFRPDHTGYQAVFAEAQRRGWVNPATRPEPENPITLAVPMREIVDPETGEVIEEVQIVNEPFRASDLHGAPPERQWIVPEWIVEGAVNSLYGDGGVGKTLLAQQLACSVSLGAPWLGLPTKPGTVLAVLCEDEKDELHRRQNHIKAAMGHAMGNPFSSVWLWPRVGDSNILVRWDRDGKAELGEFYQFVVQQVERLSPSLLILDTLADVYGGNEIDRPQVNYFVKTVLGGLIKARGAAGKPLTVLLLGHPSVAGKASGSGYSGSTAWNNAVRSRMYLTRPEEGAADERVLTRGKANYASSGDETAVRLFFADGVLHAQDDAQDGDSLLWGAMRDAVAMVDCQWRAGSPYNERKGHARYIHTALPAALISSGYSPSLTRQAIRECIEERRIGPGKSNGKSGYRSLEHVQ